MAAAKGRPPPGPRAGKAPKPSKAFAGQTNPRQTEQSRRLLGKHYANKYGTVKR